MVTKQWEACAPYPQLSLPAEALVAVARLIFQKMEY
jgi:hypothetical protein